MSPSTPSGSPRPRASGGGDRPRSGGSDRARGGSAGKGTRGSGGGSGSSSGSSGSKGSRSTGSGSSSGSSGYKGSRSTGSGSSGSSGYKGSRSTGSGQPPGGPRTGRSSAPRDERPDRAPVVRKGWGSVARRGASTVRDGVEHGPDKDTPEGRRRSRKRTDEFVPERWIQEDRGAASRSAVRPPAHRPVQAPAELPADIANELASAAGPDWSHLRERMTERMAAGIGAYERERYRDASRILKTVADAVPNAPSVRELLALSQYHQGYWKAALVNLEAFAALTGSVDQHPVRMDCQRALGRPKRVEALFTELRHGSPDPEVLSEGRLVLAGTRADGGDLTGAIALLVEAGAGRLVRNPAERHLRQRYVLGDLMERSGDLPKARELFLRVAAVDPDAYDVAQRLDSLGPPTRSRRTPKGPRRTG